MIRIALMGGGDLMRRVVERIQAAPDMQIVRVFLTSDMGETGALKLVSTLEELDRELFDVCLACNYIKLLPVDFVTKHKVINSHAGLLPRWRGIHGNGWAMLNGEKEIGITFHRVNEVMDGGPIVHQQAFAIDDGDTYGEVKDRIEAYYLDHIVSILRDYAKGSLPERPQEEDLATYVGRRGMRDCYLSWELTSDQVVDFVRALAPPGGPGAFTVYRNEKLIILDAEKIPVQVYQEIPGHVVRHLPGKGVYVKTGDGLVLVRQVEFRDKVCRADELFKTVGVRLGIDLIGDQLRQLNLI